MTDPVPTHDPALAPDVLERQDLLVFPRCPFALPPADELEFLRAQPAAASGHKDVSFDPQTERLAGLRRADPATPGRLADILTRFSTEATRWVTDAFPAYAAGLVRDRVTLRTAEEATRNLRLTSRNDLLHIDNFPTRPANGRRILRVVVNINPIDPQVWATSERFPALLARLAVAHRIPARTAEEWLAPAQPMLRLFTGLGTSRSAYDLWMQRLHHFLKEDNAFQASAARRIWTMPTGSAWAHFADGTSHAQLRGRYTLEHTFFVPFESLVCPDESPLVHLVQAGGRSRRQAG